MPGPFEKPDAPDADALSEALERGARSRQILALGVGEDLEKRRRAIWRVAENELLGGVLTPDRAYMHVACSNALRAYGDELKRDITGAQRAADQLHAEKTPPADAGS